MKKSATCWLVTLKNAAGKTKTVEMPGGLSQAEALRCAVLRVKGSWWTVSAQQTPIESKTKTGLA